MTPRERRPAPKPMTLGDAIGGALKAEIEKREAARKRRADLDAMGFRVPPAKAAP